MRAALYARVSTQEQADHNYSLESQMDKLRAYCDLHNHTIADEYVDGGYSGTTDNRPELQRLMRDIEAGLVEVLVVYKLDRFFRNQRHLYNGLHTLENYGVAFVSVTQSFDTGTPAGKAMLGVLGTFAQLERDTLMERAMDGKRKAAQKGNYTGGTVGYGYTINPQTKAIELEPAEAAIVQQVFGWATEGHTTRWIANRLTAMGVPTKFSDRLGVQKSSGRWQYARIAYMLHNRAYVGEWNWGKQARRAQRVITEGKCPAIVSEVIWQQAQIALAANFKSATRNSKRDYLLSGLIKCSCGRAYCGSYYSKANGSKVYYYRCLQARRGTHCAGSNLRAEFLEELVWNDIKGFLQEPVNVIGALEAMRTTEADTSDELDRIEDRLQELGQQESRLIRLYTLGSMSSPALDQEHARIQAERRATLGVKAEIVRERADADARRQRISSVRRQLDELATGLVNPTPEQKREVVRTLVSGLTVSKRADGEPMLKVIYIFGEPSGVIASQALGSSSRYPPKGLGIAGAVRQTAVLPPIVLGPRRTTRGTRTGPRRCAVTSEGVAQPHVRLPT